MGQTMSLGPDLPPLLDSFNEVPSFPDKLSPYAGKMRDSGQNLCFHPFSSKLSMKKKKKKKKELVFLVAYAKFSRVSVIVSN